MRSRPANRELIPLGVVHHTRGVAARDNPPLPSGSHGQTPYGYLASYRLWAGVWSGPALCRLLCRLGRLLGLFSPADSGIESKQERQIVRPTSDLDVFLPEIGLLH